MNKPKLGRKPLPIDQKRVDIHIKLPPIKLAALKMATQGTKTQAIEAAVDHYLNSIN